MQHTIGNLNIKSEAAGSNGATATFAGDNDTATGREAAAEEPAALSMTDEEEGNSEEALKMIVGSQMEPEVLDVRLTAKRLLKYVVKSAEVKMMESEHNTKLKSAGYNVCLMLIMMALIFG